MANFNIPYKTEREGQMEFFDNYGIPYIDDASVLVDNTDGIYNGNIIEFKLSINNLNRVLFQAIKYLSKMRVKGESVPATILLVDLNSTTVYAYKSEDYRDEIQLYRVRDIAFKQNFYERLCRVGSIHLCSTDTMTPEIDIRRIKNPRDVKEVLSKTIEACRKANGIRTSEIIGDHGRFPEPDPHGMPPEPCYEHPHN